jgi:hypothetical protein
MSSLPTRPLTAKARPRHRLTRGGALTAVVAAAVSLSAAACGGGSGARPSSVSDAQWSTARVVAYADCMRAHGVPDYPDPGSSVSGLNMDSPSFRAAEAKCYKLRPFGLISTHATEQQVRQAIETTNCIRDHGVPGFPDPTVTSAPPTHPSGPPSTWGASSYSYEYSNGILFTVPVSIMNSPAFQAAAKACNVAQQFAVAPES